MNFSKILSLLVSVVLLLSFSPLDVFAQGGPTVPLPAEPGGAGSIPGPASGCFIQSNPGCSNFVTPLSGSCVGQCDQTTEYSDEFPNGFVVWNCPQKWAENIIEGRLVFRVLELTEGAHEEGFEEWEEIDEVNCIEYKHCLCDPNPSGMGPKVCVPCECNHEAYSVAQSHVDGPICNEQQQGLMPLP